MTREQYHVYLRSPKWLSISVKVKALAGGRCRLCNSSEKLNVHHRTYERIGKEDLDDLTCLCHTCHNIFHSIPKAGIKFTEPTFEKIEKSPTFYDHEHDMATLVESKHGVMLNKKRIHALFSANNNFSAETLSALEKTGKKVVVCNQLMGKIISRERYFAALKGRK